MAIRPIEWDALSPAERLALVAAGEQGPLAFTALWYNLLNGDTFKCNWHHHYFDWAARKMFDGEVKSLIVNLPPGGTKTEFWSIHIPAYAMTKYSRTRILNACYSKSLTEENSTRTRAIIESAEYQTFYPGQLGKAKMDDWTLQRKGRRAHQLYSRSSGGQITGVRGGFLSPGYSGHICADDWDKVDDLFSETKRKRYHTRIVSTLRSRRANNRTPFVFVQQRCHADDSTAFLLANGAGISIDLHIKIPAIITPEYIAQLPPELIDRCVRDVCSSPMVDGGWSYWPDKEDIHDLIALREANPYTFYGQYMQSPETLDGGIFASDWFLFYGNTDDGADLPTPEGYEYRFITVDTAQKTNEWNDWTVFAEWGLADGRLYRLAYLRKRMEATELRLTFETFVNAAVSRTTAAHGALRAVYVEDKSSGTGLIQECRATCQAPIIPVPRQKDKLTRAMDVQAHAKAGKVVLPYGDKDNVGFIAEVASFTPTDSHAHDDQTDVMIDALDLTFVQPIFTGAGVLAKTRHRGNQ